MGKKAKEHRKKVQIRNQKIKEAQKAFGKVQKNILEQLMASQAQNSENYSPPTPNTPSVDANPFQVSGPQI
ncbi:hypothetical protein EBU71_06900 [bacterium]|jgi:hypothetical protein|nr:hypothetical protein [Candidatus Elulimicrobium humile]